ncbi:hypothetical protein [Acinetobacter sp. P1(2025)]|uniref:hypothetical protein n=1 Tax=Acinetobacter sp. P1(2025) TaxID=3446120 RepID=UPI003F532ED0
MQANLTINVKSRTSFVVVNHNINRSGKGYLTQINNNGVSPLSTVTGELVDQFIKVNLDVFAQSMEAYAATNIANKVPFGIKFNDKSLNTNDASIPEILEAVKTGQFIVDGQVGIGAVRRIAAIAGLQVEQVYNKKAVTAVTLKAE